MKKAIEPLNEYITKFEKFSEVIKMDPEKYVAQFDIEGSEKPVEFLLDEVKKWKTEEEKLEKSLLNSVHVSCFRVDSKEIIKKMNGIFKEIQSKLVELIAKRAKGITNGIFENFKDIQQELRKTPQTIEDLTKLKEMIANELPDTIDKLQQETKEAMELFEKLEEINYKMPAEELNKKWILPVNKVQNIN